jgi:hypothetical protein
MPSITSWIRLEPRSRDVEMDTSLQASIYDPLWLLARQWHLGEFQGEDNGSPVMTRWRAEAARLTRYHSGEIASKTRVDDAPRYDGRHMPLETLVERETVRPAIDQTEKLEKLRLAAEAGQHFLRMLDQQPLSRNYRADFIDHYAFRPLPPEQRATLDSESLNFFDLMASRVPDGFLLYVVFNPTSAGGSAIEPALQIAESDLAEVEKVVQFWPQWYETLFSEPEVTNGSWSPERMEYAFSIAARLGEGEHTLTAQEYYGGHLDWYAFDVNPEVNLGADDAITDITSTAIPAPVSFRGMPAVRFWEFEDAQVDFGAVDAGPTDLLHMLLVEFALDYGNDWFVIPIELKVGSLYRTHSLVITDTFGVRTLIRPSSKRRADPLRRCCSCVMRWPIWSGRLNV